MKKRKISLEFLNAMAEAVKILGNGQRLQIIEHLDLHGESKVSDVVAALGAHQGAISQHLNKMRIAGLVSCRRESREVYYRIVNEAPVTLLDCIRRKYEQSLEKEL